MLLPRVVMVFGTSLAGIVLLAVGSCVLLSTRWPPGWSAIDANRGWFVAGLGVLLAAALSYQARQRRAALPARAPQPAPA